MKPINVQDSYLHYLITKEIPVTLITKNGVPLKGTIAYSDAYTVTMQSQGKQSLFFKAAISTITPVKPVPLPEILK
ncbi:RNA-binding protein Hfq [Brevibacillus reuszeri]|uniref:RNA-binding protein Hfq n=1 Tax=Brevibacillus reuszeri TaxID=54915 RepID=A0A0K9YMV3_9BACL|nr:RNA chaperone Hfq [Brevibacillus reuszeri]KNB70078.1 hypothetical protein ADS79_24850 [Brevibacillus reuszeri]MED1860088.1 RNA chaperone Hfq [Brevibacillus reuszeri]GED71720.1 RNA-binding protein Hfq [Brevibacillus reuszeri]